MEIVGTQRHRPGGHHHQPPGEHDLRGAGQRDLPGGDRTHGQTTGTGQTLDLVASITADSGSVTEGETARFTVTLSRGRSFANIRVEAPMDRGFRRRRNAHRSDTRADHSPRMEVQTRRGSTAGGGQVTAQILQDDAYRLDSNNSASIRINRRALPTPTPIPTPTPVPDPTPDPYAGHRTQRLRRHQRQRQPLDRLPEPTPTPRPTPDADP